MAIRQVDETEFLNAQNVVAAVNEMLANKEARTMLLKARKTANPNVSIPEIDAAAPVQSEISELRKVLAEQADERKREREEAAASRALEAQQRTYEKQERSLRDAGWREEGIAEIKKHALERGIPDLEVAAAHWEKLHPPSDVVQPSGSGSWSFLDGTPDDDTFVKAMIASKGEDEVALNKEISATLKEFRSQQAARR